jgi:hypothetical protein
MTPRGVARSHRFDYRSSPTGHSGRCLVPCPKVTSRLMQRYFAPEGEASAPQGDSETPLGAPLLSHGPTAHYWGNPQTPRRPDGPREALRRPPVRSPSGRPGGHLKCSVSVRPSVDRPHRRASMRPRALADRRTDKGTPAAPLPAADRKHGPKREKSCRFQRFSALPESSFSCTPPDLAKRRRNGSSRLFPLTDRTVIAHRLMTGIADHAY